jgi:hypothetical protein
MKINTGCWMDGCKCFDKDDEDGVEIKRDREWVGLTDAERDEIREQAHYEFDDISNAIEAKLKEKNNDR